MRSALIVRTTLLALIATLLYLFTLARHFTADSLVFALDLESGDWRQLVDYYHLLLHPLGWVWLQAAVWLGWGGRAIYPLQWLNALAGGICVALLALIAGRVTRLSWPAWLAAAGFAVSGGFWLLSTNAEFVTPALVAQLAVLLLIVRQGAGRPPTMQAMLLVGIAIALAIGMYLTSAVLIPVALVDVFARRELPRKRRLQLAACLLLPVALAGAAALGGLWLLTGAPLGSWLAGGLTAYGGWQWSSLPHGVYAFALSLALYPGLGMNDSTRALLAAADWSGRLCWGGYYLVVLLVAGLPVVQTVRLGRRGVRLPRRFALLLAIWTTGFALFGVYWVPGDVSFWMPVLAAWWLWVAVVADTGWQRRPAPGARKVVALASLAILGLALVNLVLYIGPQHRLATNRDYAVATAVAAHTPLDAEVIVSDMDLLPLYLIYFGERRVRWLPDIEMRQAGDPPFTTQLESSTEVPESDMQAGNLYLLRQDGGTEASAWADVMGQAYGAAPVITEDEYTLYRLSPKTSH